MYIPSHFTPTPASVQELLLRHRAANLITATPSDLVATMLPLLYLPSFGVLRGHVARNNDHWRLARSSTLDSLAIVSGPDAYISPSWYATKAEHGRVVPTWNYVTAHVYGRLVVHDDPDWVRALVSDLTEAHESTRPHPWSITDAPASYIEGQLRAIVGVELVITRIEAKYKLSQNRSAEDVAGVIEGLSADGETTTAEAMRS